MPIEPEDSLDNSERRSLPRGLAKHFAVLLVAPFVLGIAMTAVVLWLSGLYYVGLPMSATQVFSALIGGGVAMMIGAGLMGALFYSNRSQWDREVR